MKTFTSVTFSQGTYDDDSSFKKIDYQETMTINDNTFTKMYSLHQDGNGQKNVESFNKILKNDKYLFEQIGSSKNKDDWVIKEFENNNLQRQYNDNYEQHKFDIPYDKLPNNMIRND